MNSESEEEEDTLFITPFNRRSPLEIYRRHNEYGPVVSMHDLRGNPSSSITERYGYTRRNKPLNVRQVTFQDDANYIPGHFTIMFPVAHRLFEFPASKEPGRMDMQGQMNQFIS